MTSAPRASSILATVLLPDPMPPVSPMVFTRYRATQFAATVHPGEGGPGRSSGPPAEPTCPPVRPPSGSADGGQVIVGTGGALVPRQPAPQDHRAPPPLLYAAPQIRRVDIQGFAD